MGGYFPRNSSINLSFLCFFNHLCNHTFCFMFQKTDSKLFVVFGMSIFRSYSLKTYKYSRFVFKLLYAFLVLVWTRFFELFFSSKKDLYLQYQSSIRIFNISFLTFPIIEDISLNSILASNLGFCVIYLFIICCWWKIHICVGMFQKPHNKPFFQSQTIAKISRHCSFKYWTQSRYACLVSRFTSFR